MKIPVKSSEPARCRWCRICVGIILIASGTLVVEGTIGIILTILGVFAIISGIIAYCPCVSICATEGEEGSCCCFAPKKTNQSNK
jgi:hypothetical protein